MSRNPVKLAIIAAMTCGSRSSATISRLFTIFLIPLLVACPADEASEEPRNRPNILLIVTDDQPVAGSLQVMDETRQAFFAGGTRWPNAFATTPSCCPSRASIFSGRYAHNHGVTSNSEGEANDLDQETTLQRHLQDSGYFTAIAGKYLNKWDLSIDPPYFDRWAINPGSPDNREYYYGSRWNVGGETMTVDEYSTTFVADKALEFLEEASEEENRPWFLYVSPLAPHSDFAEPPIPEPKYENAAVPPWTKNPGIGESDRSDKPRFVQRQDYQASYAGKVRRLQLQSLMSVDDLVGQLFDKLQETGQEGDTLAIFVSDNGYMWGEHGLVTKVFPYTPSIQVPLMLRWPGRVEAGATDSRLAANLDIFATVLDAAGLSGAAEHTDGHSLLDRGWTRDRLLTEGWGWKYVGLPEWASIRTPRYQYIEYYRDGDVIGHEYYDLRSDPWQLTNLLNDGEPGNDPDLGPLSQTLARDRVCRGDSCP